MADVICEQPLMCHACHACVPCLTCLHHILPDAILRAPLFTILTTVRHIPRYVVVVVCHTARHTSAILCVIVCTICFVLYYAPYVCYIVCYSARHTSAIFHTLLTKTFFLVCLTPVVTYLLSFGSFCVSHLVFHHLEKRVKFFAGGANNNQQLLHVDNA